MRNLATVKATVRKNTCVGSGPAPTTITSNVFGTTDCLQQTIPQPIQQTTVQPIPQPTRQPTVQHILQPTLQPTVQHILQPTLQPSPLHHQLLAARPVQVYSLCSSSVSASWDQSGDCLELLLDKTHRLIQRSNYNIMSVIFFLLIEHNVLRKLLTELRIYVICFRFVEKLCRTTESS